MLELPHPVGAGPTMPFTRAAAFFTASASVLLGCFAAFALVKYRRFRGRTLFAGMVNAPLVMPEVIVGLSLLLMLYCLWLTFKGAWEQFRINRDSTSPVMEVSQALFYGSGIFGAVLGGLMIAHKLWRMKAGRLPDFPLIV